MKVNKKFFICAMLVLMLFLCINASSATEPLNQTLGADIGDEIAIGDASNDNLSASGDTYVVDANGGGDYQTISDAVSAATGGETIFVKNGEYSEANTITFTKSVSIVGESQDGVKITGASKSLFSTVEPAISLSLSKLTILNAGGGSNPALKLTYSAHNLTVTDCTFDSCRSKWGTIQLGHPGTAVIDNCKILNSQETSTAGSGAVYASGAGQYTISNTIIDNVQYTPTSSYMQAAIYVSNANAVLNIENTTISNITAPTRGVIQTVGTVNIKGSKIQDNTLNQFSDAMTSHVIYIGDKGKVNIEQTEISDNTCQSQLFNNYKDTSSLTVNYCNIHDNAASGTVNSLGTIDLEANYWGSNDKPADVTATTWVVDNNGNYELNNGQPLAEEIPGLTDEGGDEPQPASYDVYVSPDGSGDGSSYDSPMSDFMQAFENVPEGGSIFFLNGVYSFEWAPVLYKSVSLVGESRDGVILTTPGSGSALFSVYNVMGDPMEDLQLDFISISDMTFSKDNFDPFIHVCTSVNEFNVTNCVMAEGPMNLPVVMVGINVMGEPYTSFGGTLNFKKNIVTGSSVIDVAGLFNANINDNIFLDGNSGENVIGFDSEGNCNVEYNYWGSNNPNVQLDYNEYIIVTASSNATEIYNDENAKITIETTLKDGTTNAKDHLPDYPIEATLTAAGDLSANEVTLQNGVAEVTYSSNVVRNDNVGISILDESLSVPITVKERYTGIIYVATTGNDDNEGSESAPVASINKAVELALVNGGSGKIIISEGTYAIDSTLAVNKDLDVSGVGNVVIDGASKKIIENTANLNLTNIKFTGGADTSACVLVNKGNATLQSCEVYSNAYPSGYGSAIIRNNDVANNLVINNSKFHDNNAIYGTIYNNKGNVILSNSEIYDNDMSEYSSATSACALYNVAGQVTIQNTNITDNKGRRIVESTASGFGASQVKGSLTIINTTFDSNTATEANGAAIYAEDSIVSIEDSTFTNGIATKGSYSGGQGGAIYSQGSTITIDSSVFKNNVASEGGNDIYMYSGSIDMANSVLLNENGRSVEINSGNNPTVNVNDNFWGNNAEANVGAGIAVDRWVILNADFTPSDAGVGDEVTITASFNQTNSSTGLSDYAGNLPDGIEIAVASTTADIATLTIQDGSATTTYTIVDGDKVITATSGSAVVEMPIAQDLTNIVTQDNFYTFFDESGFLKDEVPFDELIFQGEFSDLAAGYVIITKPVTITGDNAVLNNMGFVISSENVALDNLTLVATTCLGDLISVSASHVDLTNLDISYILGDEGAIAINVKGPDEDEITDVNILNNKIYFESHVSEDSKYAVAINLEIVQDSIVDGNNISASVPGLYVGTYDYDYFMMGLVYVNPIRIYEGYGVEFTNNNIDVVVNDCTASFPTTQAMYIVGSEDILIKGNNFTMIDTATPIGTSMYLYAVECGFSEDVSFIENNFNISTTGGQSGAGSAYALQVATSEATFIGNNLTCDSNGPNLGIFSPYGFGPAKDLVIKDNFLNITGYAAGSGDFALISGIEIQTGYAKIYNNTIYVQNKGDYGDKYPVSAISAVQYSASTLTFDVKDNEVYTNGKYAVEMLYPPKYSVVVNNTLYAHDLKGDEAVYIKSGDNNTVHDNLPERKSADIIIDADAVWIGNNAAVSVTVPNATGTVTIEVNNKSYGVVDLDESSASVEIAVEDLVAGKNNITVTYEGPEFKTTIASDVLHVLDGVVNQENYMGYFNQADEGRLFDYVPEGTTLDFQGSIINPDSSIILHMNVNKPVNIVSTTKDAYVDLNTIAGSLTGESPGNSFAITNGGSGTNVTGITFHNTQLWLANTHNVVLDNISAIVEDQRVGSGVGVTSIRDNSTYVTVKNSYFYTRNNGGSSSLVFGWADYCTWDNNTVEVEGEVGNMFYLNTFNVNIPSGVVANQYNVIKNNVILAINRPAAAICWGIVINGKNNLVENNTVYYKGVGIAAAYGGNSENNTYRGNKLYNGSSIGGMGSFTSCTFEDNYVSGAATIGENCKYYNNTIEGKVTINKANVVAYNNTINNAVTISASNVTFACNDVTNTVTVSADGNRIINNTIITSNANTVDLKNKKNNNVTGNILYAASLTGDSSVKYSGASNIVKDNYPILAEVFVEATDVFEGQATTITVTVPDATGNVTVRVNGRDVAIVELVDGVAIYSAPKEEYENNYTVSVSYNGDLKYLPNSNVTTFNVIGNVVTNDTFYTYFSENGDLLANIPFEELIFNGTFSDLTDMIVFNRPISVVGENAVLENIAIRIASNDVSLSDFALNADKEFANNDGALIYATGANIELSDLAVNYVAPIDAEAIAIYANAAENFELINSEVIFTAGENPGSNHYRGLEVRNSNNALIDNNTINAVLPAVPVDFSASGIAQDLVLAVGIQGGDDIKFTNNRVNVNTNGAVGSYPTIDAVMIHSTNDISIKGNNITHIDTTTEDGARYYYSLDIYSTTGTVEENNIVVNTTAGVDRAGTAYPIQLTGPFTVTVKNNNLTAVSKGPIAGIYASNWPGAATLTVENNNIDVRGYATTGNYALVAGIEAEIDVFKAYNNTITVANGADYDDANQVIGVGIGSSYFYGDTSADIKDNTITVDGKYAVYYAKAINTNVTGNTLYGHELEGDDAAIINSGDNNVIENNLPAKADISVVDVSTWIGNAATVTVNVPNATGTVAIEVNGKSYDVELVDGVAAKEIPAEDLVAGENIVTATYSGPDFASNTATGSVYVIDGVVTQDTYLYYFNQEDNGKLFDYIPDGATLDFQGSIINPDQSITVQMNVNKPVNIVSTTKDAYVDLNTTAGSLLGESPGNSFAVTNGGSGSNVTGIYFHNTQVWISNTHDVVLDNISVVVEDQRVGSGVGATTIRDNSSNVVLKNSYLYTRNNGGSTTFTMSWTTNCTIDNCTVKAEGNVGNLIYLNIFNVVGAPSGVPLNNNNTVSNNRIYGKEGSSISVGLMVEGSNNLIVNNTLYKSSISTSFGGSNPANNTYVGNTMTEGSGLTALAKSIVYGNNVTGSLTTGANSVAYDNIIGTKLTVSANSKAYNNTVSGTVATGGVNAVIENNTIAGAVTINKAGTTFIGNDVGGTVTVSANNNVIKENTITSTGTYAVDLGAKTGNNVTDNYLVASELKGDAAVKFSNANNVVENNRPYVTVLNVTVVNATTLTNAKITVTSNAEGVVSIKVGDVYEADNVTIGEEFTLPILPVGVYDVIVTYEETENYLAAVNDTEKLEIIKATPEITVTADDVAYGDVLVVDVELPADIVAVNVTVGDETKEVVLVDGKASVEFAGLVPGEYVVVASFAGDDKYNEASANITVNVNKANSILTANDTTVGYLSGGKVVATIKDAQGNPISGVEIIAVINDASETLLSDANGEVYLDVGKLALGNYTATFTFAGNDNYMESNTTANVEIGKEDTIITLVYDADANEVIATLTTVDGLGLSHTPIIITIDGVDHHVATNSRGVAKLSLTDLIAGNYNVTGTYNGNGKFNSDNETININVTVKMDTVISLVYDANAKELIATLTTNNGLALDLTSMVIDINGVDYNVTTDSDGVAKVSVTDLTPGVYNATAAFEGNDKFNPSNATKTLYIDVAMDTVIDLVYDEEANELVATLSNAEGIGLSSTTININVARTDYAVKTNNRGVAKLSTADLKPGVYNATASFNGNSKFKSTNATVVVNTRIDTAITLVYDEAAKELVATLNIVEGSVLTGTTVNINVDGVDYAVKTNSRGVAKLSVADLAPGSYVATATYNGNYKYDTAEATINMRVKTETAINLVYDETAKELVATLNTADGGPLSGTTVNINVDGVDYAVKTSSRGVAKVSTADLAPGSYVATATYNGNYRFSQAESSINMRVKTETVLSAVYDADAKELSVTLTTAEGGPLSSTTVNINIDGVDYAAKTNNKGVAKLSTADLAPGSYTASISYAGNYRFGSDTTTIDIEV